MRYIVSEHFGFRGRAITTTYECGEDLADMKNGKFPLTWEPEASDSVRAFSFWLGADGEMIAPTGSAIEYEPDESATSRQAAYDHSRNHAAMNDERYP